MPNDLKLQRKIVSIKTRYFLTGKNPAICSNLFYYAIIIIFQAFTWKMRLWNILNLLYSYCRERKTETVTSWPLLLQRKDQEKKKSSSEDEAYTMGYCGRHPPILQAIVQHPAFPASCTLHIGSPWSPISCHWQDFPSRGGDGTDDCVLGRLTPLPTHLIKYIIIIFSP